MTRRMSTSLVLLAVLIVVGSPPAQANSPLPMARGREITSHSVTLPPSRIRSYWTPQRMSQARPLERLLLESPPASMISDQAPVGPQRSIAPIAPTGATHVERSLGTTSIATTSALSDFMRAEVSGDYKTFPLSTNGKVFGTTGKGASYVCSGTAINSGNMSVVWTAAHCVYGTDPGSGWATKLTFVPAYKDGNAPFGEWPMHRAWVPDGWIGLQSLSHDNAALVVSPKPNGDRLVELTGGRGIKWNASPEQAFQSFGYPAKWPFSGQRMITCESSYQGQGDADGGLAPVSMGCDMTAGSSGGGWIVEGQFLNSNVSHSYVNLPGVLFGPYFDDVAGRLYETASAYELPGEPESPGEPGSPEEPGLPEEPESHHMILSLDISKAPVARGRLLAEDGYSACAANTTVGIYRKKRSDFVQIKVASTDEEGHYTVRLKKRRGRYLAFTEARVVGGADCSEATSPVRRIR
jgi:V8-like Glu-specific endopeptidase